MTSNRCRNVSAGDREHIQDSRSCCRPSRLPLSPLSEARNRFACSRATLCQALGFTTAPHRTTVNRRLPTLLLVAEALVAALDTQIIKEIQPHTSCPQSSATNRRI